MALDKTNKVIMNLVVKACASIKYGSDLTAEECIVQLVSEQSRHPEGHDGKEIIHRLTAFGKYSTTEVETALQDLLDAGILKGWEPMGSIIGDRPTLYSLTLDFVSLMSSYTGEKGKQVLLDVNIKVKDNNVKIGDLYQFYKNVLWLFETQQNLEHIHVGRSKLTKQEAIDLYAVLKKQKAFE
ncbi:hypothetical protein [Burkholderia phage FLC6]|nr:hypothetical protein [Burkholderia phage FLC6]